MEENCRTRATAKRTDAGQCQEWRNSAAIARGQNANARNHSAAFLLKSAERVLIAKIQNVVIAQDLTGSYQRSLMITLERKNPKKIT
jgi:hypothetical protein